MKRECFQRPQHVLAAVGLCFLAWAGNPAVVSGQLMSNYTNLPVFLNQTVNPNILFLVDMGNYTLEAAYSGTNHRYWLSFKAGTVTDGQLAANVTVNSATGDDLVAGDKKGVPITAASGTSPADIFVPTKSYYGMFDPLRCYTTDTNSFNYASKKTGTDVSEACGNSYWDGNFLNWLTTRKKE